MVRVVVGSAGLFRIAAEWGGAVLVVTEAAGVMLGRESGGRGELIAAGSFSMGREVNCEKTCGRGGEEERHGLRNE